MAASLSHGARGSPPAERFQLLRELGSRAIPIWVARECAPNARDQIVVVQRVLRRGAYGEGEITAWVSNARRLVTLDHPNVGRMRDVAMRRDDVLFVGDYIDGVRWSELYSSPSPPALELSLRVLVDVLAGLSAIHNLRDAKRQPLKLVHGELTPECVLVGLDGVARVVDIHPTRMGAAGSTEAASSYLAPEVLLADDTADPRADVYSVGAMLWEALSGRALFAKTLSSAIVTQILSGQVPRATLPVASAWATPLVDAAARALSADPGKRFSSAAAFAAELRRIAGARLAPASRIGALVRAGHGDRIRSRREAIERGEGPEARSERVSVDVPIDVDVDFGAASPSEPPLISSAPAAPTTRPPPPAAPAPPVLPPIRSALPPPKSPPVRPPARIPPHLPIAATALPPVAPAESPGVSAEETASPAVLQHAAALRASEMRLPRRPGAIVFVIALVTVSVALAWWLSPHALRTADPKPFEPPTPSPAESSAPAALPTATMPPSDPVTSAPAVMSAPAAAPQAPPPPAAAPGPSLRAAPQPKYDPQGI